MARTLTALSVLTYLVTTALADTANDIKIVQHLQDISVTVLAGRSSGSGVVKTRDGINFIWTAGHVVAGLRTTRQVVNADGSTRTIIEFEDAKIVKTLHEDGRIIGRLELDAKVIKYSDSETGDDLALLMVRKKNFVSVDTTFYLKKELPPLGLPLFHVGSLLGEFGSNSVTTGIMSQHGRMLFGKVFDQSNLTAMPGSSGGGIYNKETGEYVGMLVRGAGEGFNLMVPVRRMVEWSKKNKVEWAINNDVKLPSLDEIEALSIDATNASAGRSHHSKTIIKTWEYIKE